MLRPGEQGVIEVLVRTEPDVVVDAGAAGVVVIEVKYTSPNDVQVPSNRFDRYLDGRPIRVQELLDEVGPRL